MRLPLQRLCNAGNNVVTACDTSLQLIEASSGAVVSSAGNAHDGFIRLLLVDRAHQWLVSTGEDKLLKVWSLPSLALMSSRELPRRANALALTSDEQQIVVADKFGDVYSYDLHASEPTAGPSKPLLGHVSLLTAVHLTADGNFVITADRDEHIRISHWPQAFDIDAYLLGHRRFVSSILSIDDRLLLSAGGDDDVYVWDLTTRKLKRKIDISELARFCQVAPVKAPWIGAKDKKPRGKKRKKGKGKEKEVVEEPEVEVIEAEAEAELADDEVEMPVTRLAISKMAVCGKGEDAVVVVSASGASAVAYFPVASLNGDSTPTARFFDTTQPVLDLCASSDRLIVSLDRSRLPEATSQPSLSSLNLFNGELRYDEATFDACFSEASDKMPDDGSLYAELALLHKDPADTLPEPTEGPRDHKPGRPPKKPRRA